MDVVKGEGNWTPGLSNVGVGGVQIAEVWVDTETGVVRSPAAVQPGQPLRVEVAEGEFGARVE